MAKNAPPQVPTLPMPSYQAPPVAASTPPQYMQMQSPSMPVPAPSALSLPAPTQSSAGWQGGAAQMQPHPGQPQPATQQYQGAGPMGMMPYQSGITQAGNTNQQEDYDWIQDMSALSLQGPIQNNPTRGQAPAARQLVSSEGQKTNPWGHLAKVPSQTVGAPEAPRPMNFPFMNTQVNPALGRGAQKSQSRAAPANDRYIMPQSLAQEMWEQYLPKWPLYYGCGYFEAPVHPSANFNELVLKDLKLVQRYMDASCVYLAIGQMTKPNTNKLYGRKLILSFVDEKVKDDKVARERLLVGWEVIRMWSNRTAVYYEKPSPENMLLSLFEFAVQMSDLRLENYLEDTGEHILTVQKELLRDLKGIALKRAEQRRNEQEAQEKLREEAAAKEKESSIDKKESSIVKKESVSEQKKPAVGSNEPPEAVEEAEKAVSSLVKASSDFYKQLDAVESWVKDLTRNPCIQESQRKAFAGKILVRDGDLRRSEEKMVEVSYIGIRPSDTPEGTPAAAGGKSDAAGAGGMPSAAVGDTSAVEQRSSSAAARGMAASPRGPSPILRSRFSRRAQKPQPSPEWAEDNEEVSSGDESNLKHYKDIGSPDLDFFKGPPGEEKDFP